jgi:hypothetical protein
MRHAAIRRRLPAALALALAAPIPAAAPPPPDFDALPSGHAVVRVYYDAPEDVAALADYDVFEFNDRQERYVLVAVDAAEHGELQATGWRVVVDDARTAEINQVREPLPGQVQGIPGFPCYRTVEETFATAAQLAQDHPDLATWTDVGNSWEKTALLGGYDMNILRLTHSAIPGPKPKLIISSAIHAREYATAELATRFAEQLVQGYGTDADATWLLDHHEIHLLLHTNPDGRKQAESGQLWRKNTNKNYCGPTSVNRGADLNRNFEFEWGCCGGSSGSQCSETYRGPAPASEPEVQALQAYLRAQFPDQRDDPLGSPAPADATGVYIDLHSYSELVLWPWGFGSTAPNGTALQTLGRKLALSNGYFPEQAIGLYVTDGTTIDFAYGDLGVAAYVFEIGTQFFQSCTIFDNTILPDNLPSLIYAAKVARTPYLTPSGPDAVGLQASPQVVVPGTPLVVSATADDTRFNNQNGTEPVQPVTAAELYLDLPPWDPQAVALPMIAGDGAFGEPVEAVEASLDTGAIAGGRHIVFVRGRDAAGNWGATSAVFFDVVPAAGGTVAGRVTDAESGAPLAAAVSADVLGLTAVTDPETGDYALTLPAGTWGVRASAVDHVDQQQLAQVSVDGTTVLDFGLWALDADGDGVGNPTDCDPVDPIVWAAPTVVRNLALAKTFINNLSWQSPQAPGSTVLSYDVLRSGQGHDFSNALCSDIGGSDTISTDSTLPAKGAGYYYLIRARNRCGENLGTDSAGNPRTGKDCVP